MAKRFHQALQEAENGVREGWIPSINKWFPHKSKEGGTHTIAYGHKLTEKEQETGYILLENGGLVPLTRGLSEEEAQLLYEQDIKRTRERLQRKIKDFDQMSERDKLVLTNVEFNTGDVAEDSWPKLLKAIRSGNDAGIFNEMRTKGPKGPLTERRDLIAESLGLLPSR